MILILSDPPTPPRVLLSSNSRHSVEWEKWKHELVHVLKYFWFRVLGSPTWKQDGLGQGWGGAPADGCSIPHDVSPPGASAPSTVKHGHQGMSGICVWVTLHISDQNHLLWQVFLSLHGQIHTSSSEFLLLLSEISTYHSTLSLCCMPRIERQASFPSAFLALSTMPGKYTSC